MNDLSAAGCLKEQQKPYGNATDSNTEVEAVHCPTDLITVSGFG